MALIVKMGKKRVMLPAKDVDLSSVKYEDEVIKGLLHSLTCFFYNQNYLNLDSIFEFLL